MPDDSLQSLQDHYVNLGFDFSEIAEEEEQPTDAYGHPAVYRDTCTIREGFVLPEEYGWVEAEELIEELMSHEEAIEAELSAPPKTGFFGVDETNLRRRLRLIALRGLRCYSIVQELKSKEAIFSTLKTDFDIDMSVERDTLQDYLLENEEQAS